MGINKKILLNSFFNLLKEDQGFPEKLIRNSPEDSIIRDLHKQNIDHLETEVPPGILKTILDRTTTETMPEPLPAKSLSDIFSYKLLKIALIPAVSFILIAGIFILFRGESKTSEINIASITPGDQSTAVFVRKNTKIIEQGLEIKALSDGMTFHVTAFQGKQKVLERNIYFNSGTWDIKTRHQDLEMETWFHFPGGAVRPIGTAFSIKIDNNKSMVSLSEGKIEIIANDNQRSVESAPFNALFQDKTPAPQPDGKIINENIPPEPARTEPVEQSPAAASDQDVSAENQSTDDDEEEDDEEDDEEEDSLEDEMDQEEEEEAEEEEEIDEEDEAEELDN